MCGDNMSNGAMNSRGIVVIMRTTCGPGGNLQQHTIRPSNFPHIKVVLAVSLLLATVAPTGTIGQSLIAWERPALGPVVSPAAVAQDSLQFSANSTGRYEETSWPTTSLCSNCVVGTVSIGTQTYPNAAAYDGSDGYVYVSDWWTASSGGPSKVSALSDTSVVGTITGLAGSDDEVYDSANGYVYVANQASGNISVISGMKTVGSVPIATFQAGMAYDSSNGYVYVANDENPGLVWVISGLTVVGNISVGNNPKGVTFDSGDGDIYVGAGSTVSVIAGFKVVENITMPIAAGGMAYDSSNGYVYIANSASGSDIVTVVSGGKAVGNITGTFDDPAAVAYDSSDEEIYVVNGYGAFGSPSTVVVVSGMSVVGTITVGNGAVGITYDDGNTYLYVPNSDDGTVSVIAGGTTPTLSSLSVSPSIGTLQVGLSADFTATPSCTGGPCPSGIAYSWSLTNNLATLNTTAGNPIKVTAGPTTGPVTLFLNATLNGVMKETSATITISSTPVPTLASVSVSPFSPTVTVGTTQTFTAAPSCGTSSCPTGTIYNWKLSNSLGNLSTAAGSSADFTAGSKPGTVVLTVVAALNGVTRWANATITIQTASTNSPGFLGFSEDTGYILIGAVIAVVAAVVVVLLVRRRERKRSASPPYPPQSQTWQQSPAQASGYGYPPQGWQQPPSPGAPPPTGVSAGNLLLPPPRSR